jgi:hypothetical protein
MQHEGLYQAHNVEVANCDIFATRNSLKSQEGQYAAATFSKCENILFGMCR